MASDKRSGLFAARGDVALTLRPTPAELPGIGGGDGLFAWARQRTRTHGLTLGAQAGAVDRLVVQIMSADLLTTVILQRIYLGVSVTLGTHLVAVAMLLAFGRAKVAGLRVVLYWLLWCAAMALQFMSGNTFSPSSILLALVCYLGFLVVVPANEQTYFAVVKAYQRVAAAVSVMVFLDLALQIVGFGMPNMNAVVPAGITAPTMNYVQPLTWRAGIEKPNAFFMMEASFTAQFIAVALLIEIAFFRRALWLCSFALALLGTFSGTGVMLALLTLPVLARRYLRILLIYGAVLLPILSGIAIATGWSDIAAKRMTTFDNKDSSAYQRFVGPFAMMHQVLASGDAHDIFYGFGAGKTSWLETIPGIEYLEYNSVSKVFVEYGLIVFLLFMVFITYVTFSSGVPFIIVYVAYLEYHLMGGYFTIPPILNYWYILAAGWAVTRDVPADAAFEAGPSTARLP